ncbi:DUF2231 domain-containing protein [Nonomuraea ferruginea]|uniref:DUF2231 domain-containing protein n=1 Tax=Nonomuraea ferruginea TaxID=46174 RepID=A0ABT4T7B4_9ACTN|nr:DUF2231 domain-containing protein [Nonomuraea ferruginea]MDA0645403.1 hypothetical protein [Nonomuraea ferruginea]
MFDQVLGLPAHPLVVHFAVVLTPMLVAVAVAYALVPRWRAATAWAVTLLSIAAPVAVFAAWQSGQSLKAARFATAGGELGQRISAHEAHAVPLLLSAAGLGSVSLVLVYASRGDRFGRPGTAVLSGLTVVLAAVTAYYVFLAGDSGARAVWEL